MSTDSAKFMVLWQVVEYLRAGPHSLVPPGDTGAWLETFFILSQFKTTEDLFESRSVYVPPAIHLSSNLPAVVRRVTWHRLRDRQRCRERVVGWPDVHVDHYDVRRGEYDTLDDLVQNLEEAFSQLPFHAPGLALENREQPKHQDVSAATQESNRPYLRWAQLGLTAITAEVTLMEGSFPPFDRLWDLVWDALGELCLPERRSEGYQERYWVSPETFAQVLTSTLT